MVSPLLARGKPSRYNERARLFGVNRLGLKIDRARVLEPLVQCVAKELTMCADTLTARFGRRPVERQELVGRARKEGGPDLVEYGVGALLVQIVPTNRELFQALPGEFPRAFAGVGSDLARGNRNGNVNALCDLDLP